MAADDVEGRLEPGRTHGGRCEVHTKPRTTGMPCHVVLDPRVHAHTTAADKKNAAVR